MRLTLYSDYGLRVLIFLALRPGEWFATREIAEAYGISSAHLAKVTKHLVRGGYVESARGRGGGMRLALPPREIVLGDVVRFCEEKLALVECFEPEGGQCRIESACGLARVLDEALHAFLRVLDGYTLADVIRRRSELRRLLAIV